MCNFYKRLFKFSKPSYQKNPYITAAYGRGVLKAKVICQQFVVMGDEKKIDENDNIAKVMTRL